MPSPSTTWSSSVREEAVAVLLAAAIVLSACHGDQKIDQVERHRVPATTESIRAQTVRAVAELGIQKRLRASRDLEADLRWQFTWLDEIRAMRRGLVDLAGWCETITACNMGLKVLRPDLPPLAIMNTTDFLKGIGAAPVYVYLPPTAKWLDGPAHDALTTASAAVERVLLLVDRSNELDAAEVRALVTGSRALQDALRKAAASIREGAARAEILSRVTTRAGADMGVAADRLDPFWQVGAARIAQASVDLGRIGRRARQTAAALEALAAQLVSDGAAVGKLASGIDRMLYP